jgi:uncharacterized protein (TIGR02246 family)
MWITSAIIAIGLTTSASAQGVDQNTRQQLDRMVTTYVEDWNKHDAAGIAGLYTKDGVLVTTTAAVKSGTQEIEQNYQNLFKTLSHHDGATIDQVSPLGNDAVISVGEFHLSGQGQSGPIKLDGRWTAAYVRDGGTWKIRLLTAVQNPPPAPAAAAR